MTKEIRQKLHDYYLRMDIHPSDFRCPNQTSCRQYAYLSKMTETKMTMVGSQYGDEYPKMCVVSLDPPSGEDGVFQRADQRTTEYIARYHESENFEVNRPGPHWAVTQIIVKDLIGLWGFQAQPEAVTVPEPYSGRFIENVSAYFAHVNVTKCSMNNPGRGEGQEVVHQICGQSYLVEELVILEPDIVISQGKDANRIIGKLLANKLINISDLPTSMLVRLGGKSAIWLPMHHPSRFTHKIRETWPAYLRFVTRWHKSSMPPFQQS